MKTLKVVVCCGHGMGTVFLMKMMIEEVLKEEKIKAEVIPTDIMTIGGFVDADIVVSNVDFKDVLAPLGKNMILVRNFLDKEDARRQLREILSRINK